jgi:hypothetical protein
MQYFINTSIASTVKVWIFVVVYHCRVSTGLENPGKSLKWKNKIPGLESP